MKKIFYGFVASTAVLFTGCSSDKEPTAPTGETQVENEAPKCNGTVTVMVPGESRASSSTTGIDRFTATRTDIVGSNYVLVSYHGRNQEQIGMVQLIDPADNSVVGEIVFPDSRVNYCNIRNLSGNMTAYIAVDQTSKKEAGVHLCGVVCIPMKNNKFDLGDGVTEAEIAPYYVDGVSVNCMKFIEQEESSAMIVASGSNSALGDEGMAGFTKFKINKDNPVILEATQGNNIAPNLRGYWISWNNAHSGSVYMPVAYTYRTVDNGDLVWKLAVQSYPNVSDFFNPNKSFGTANSEVVVMRKKGITDDRSRFSVSMFLETSGRFIVVATGSKVLSEEEGEGGGVRVYRYDQSNSSLNLVDVWDKACNNVSNRVEVPFTVTVDGIETTKNVPCVYAACPQGVFRCEIDYYEGIKEDGKKEYMPDGSTPVRYAQLIPVEKRVSTCATESDTYATTNYVQCNANMKTVHIAAGYEGYIGLPLTGEGWIAADPRKDLVDHTWYPW